jgi:hypothetical protein
VVDRASEIANTWFENKINNLDDTTELQRLSSLLNKLHERTTEEGDYEMIISYEKIEEHLKTIITKAHIGVSMRMVSNVMYEYNGILIMNLRDYVAHGRGEINIEYGDSWAVKRQAQLKFRVYADKGFEEVSWTDR